jgi:hypothetical protein
VRGLREAACVLLLLLSKSVRLGPKSSTLTALQRRISGHPAAIRDGDAPGQVHMIWSERAVLVWVAELDGVTIERAITS